MKYKLYTMRRSVYLRRYARQYYATATRIRFGTSTPIRVTTRIGVPPGNVEFETPTHIYDQRPRNIDKHRQTSTNNNKSVHGITKQIAPIILSVFRDLRVVMRAVAPGHQEEMGRPLRHCCALLRILKPSKKWHKRKRGGHTYTIITTPTK